MLQMFVLALSLYNTWNRGVFLLCKITNLLIYSYKEKCIKPEEKIYKTLLTRYNIKPENAIFFDDRPENVEAAKMLGIQGVVFTPEVAEEYLG